MSEENLNLIQKLARIRSIADLAVKDKKGYNYSYADIAQILASVKGGMKRYGISLVPVITPGTSEVSKLEIVTSKFDKTGKPYDQTTTEMLFKADMVFRWVNDVNPEEYIDVPWVVTGSQQDPSQAFGSAMTYCTRYFLTNYFQIPQVASEDVDSYRSAEKEAEESESKAVASAIINDFDVKLKMFLADNPDKKDDVVRMITKYVKSADYFKIKQPALASKLMQEFQEKFLGVKEE